MLEGLEGGHTSWENEDGSTDGRTGVQAIVPGVPGSKRADTTIGIVGPQTGNPPTKTGNPFTIFIICPVPMAMQCPAEGHATWVRFGGLPRTVLGTAGANQVPPVPATKSGPDAAQPQSCPGVALPTATQFRSGVHATWFRVAIVLVGPLGKVTWLQVSPSEVMVPANTTGALVVLKVPQATHAVAVGQITWVSEATFAGMVSAVAVPGPGVVVLSARTTPCGDGVPVRP